MYIDKKSKLRLKDMTKSYTQKMTKSRNYDKNLSLSNS